MKPIFIGIVALVFASSASAATIADLDAHLEAERGLRRADETAMLGTNASFCQRRWGAHLSGREQCEKEHGEVVRVVPGRFNGGDPDVACTRQFANDASAYRTCLDVAPSAR